MVSTENLFDRIGGKAALSAVVDDFYRRVLADDLLAPLFRGIDMAVQRRHQVAFLAFALGGPNEYTGRTMKAAHAGRGITAEHFVAVAGHLQGALQTAGVAAAEIDRILATAGSLQGEIVEVA